MILEPNAIAKIEEIIAGEDKANLCLRVFVQGGGCSGFQQSFALDDVVAEDDIMLNFNNVKILIDQMSWEYLKNSTISFVEDLSGSNFVITNPDATGTCGCGSSFSM